MFIFGALYDLSKMSSVSSDRARPFCRENGLFWGQTGLRSLMAFGQPSHALYLKPSGMVVSVRKFVVRVATKNEDIKNIGG